MFKKRITGPMKIFATELHDSHGEVPISFCINHAIFKSKYCIILK